MEVYHSDYFLRKHKKYLKKFRNLQSDITFCLENFKRESFISLGRNVYKARLRSSDLPKGKSGSFRLIIYLVQIKNTITPVSIYLKSDKENIESKEIKKDLIIITKELIDKSIVG